MKIENHGVLFEHTTTGSIMDILHYQEYMKEPD